MMAGCMALLLSSQPLKAQETFREMQYSPQSTVFTLNAPSRPTLRSTEPVVAASSIRR